METRIAISYDKEADVMYMAFEDIAAEAEEVEEGVFARYDPKSRKLVGFTITNFSKKFAKQPREVTIPSQA